MLLVEYKARELGLTQTAIARKCGISQPLVSRVMTGTQKPYPKIAQGIAQALDYAGDPSDLFKPVSVEVR